MNPFIELSAVAAPMPTANVDTDVIMPKAFLKRIDKEGVLDGLFHDARLDEKGREKPDFVLNQTPYRNSEILVVGPNFGCGSSREHAVWGLAARGIKALIGSSFAGIFFDNCANNGILCVVLPEAQVRRLQRALAENDNKTVHIHLAEQWLEGPDGMRLAFEIEARRKEKLMSGLDCVEQTLRKEERIRRFESCYFEQFPWLDDRQVHREN